MIARRRLFGFLAAAPLVPLAPAPVEGAADINGLAQMRGVAITAGGECYRSGTQVLFSFSTDYQYRLAFDREQDVISFVRVGA